PLPLRARSTAKIARQSGVHHDGYALPAPHRRWARHTAGGSMVRAAAQPLRPLHLPLRCLTDNEAIGEAVEDLPSFPCIARSSRGIRQVGRGPAAGGTEQPERLTSSALRNTRPTASIPSKAQSMTMSARPAGPFSDRPLIAS